MSERPSAISIPCLVRPVVQADIEQLPALLAQLWDDGHISPTAPAALREQLAEANRLFAAASIGERVVGYASVEFLDDIWRDEGELARITHIVVDASVRRQGIGSNILTYVIQAARQRGCDRLVVHSAIRYKEAHAFYSSCGFAQHSIGFGMSLASEGE